MGVVLIVLDLLELTSISPLIVTMNLIVLTLALMLCIIHDDWFVQSFFVPSRIMNRRATRTSLLRNGSHKQEPKIRIGHGYDIHRLVEGKRLVVAGVYIPFRLGADAHSDGDAVYHRWV